MMDVWLGIALVCFGFILGFAMRCDQIRSYNRGVDAGYKTALREQECYQKGMQESLCDFPSVGKKVSS